MNNKILIVSKFFYPEINPRSFRTTELVKEFCNKGDLVTLVLPNKKIYKTNSFKLNNLKIIYSESNIKHTNQKPSSGNSTLKFKARIIAYFKKILFYFFPKELFVYYDQGITKALRNIKGDYSALISISQPISIHLSSAIALKYNRNLNCKVAIAEFGDPMFTAKYFSVFPTNWLFGFLFAYSFKYFVVPVASAIPAFTPFKSAKKIKVIPQGFNLSNLILPEYEKNSVITFAYAGNFYKNLRDPEYFFTFLTKIKSDFIFELFIASNDLYFNEMIKKYEKKCTGKFKINEFIPRDQLIIQLSKMDFLINFNNENSKMVPSKLIDYAISQRPIISFNSKTFDETTFMEFMHRNYNKSVKINVQDYDIETIVNCYKELF